MQTLTQYQAQIRSENAEFSISNNCRRLASILPLCLKSLIHIFATLRKLQLQIVVVFPTEWHAAIKAFAISPLEVARVTLIIMGHTANHVRIFYCFMWFININSDAIDCSIHNGGCDFHTQCTFANLNITCGSCPLGYIGNGVIGCTRTSMFEECILLIKTP